MPARTTGFFSHLKNTFIVVAAVLFFQQPAVAQRFAPEGVPVSFSYYGELLFHPGAKVSVEFPLWMKSKEKELKNRTKVRQRRLLLIPGAGFYVHPQNHTGVFLNVEACYRKITPKSGFKLEGLTGIGYQARINAGTTYVVDDDGSVSEKQVAGRSYFTCQLGLGFGQDLYVKKQIPLAWHIRPYAVFSMPYNTTVMTSFDLEMGITYRFMKKIK